MSFIKAILKSTYRFYEYLGNLYLLPILLAERKRPPYRSINERPLEYGYAFRHLANISPELVLDVGSGKTAFPHILANCGFRVTAIDMMGKYWGRGMSNRHYHILRDDITKPALKAEFDFITCISVLEHIGEHRAALKGLAGLLKTGGHIVLTFPYNERQYVDNVYVLPDAGYGQNATFICQVFSRNEVETWLKENGLVVVDEEYYEVFTGDLWTFGERIYPPRKAAREQKHHLACLLLKRL
jgi:SAM-dependent methyltransferase